MVQGPLLLQQNICETTQGHAVGVAECKRQYSLNICVHVVSIVLL
jgi:hypothetical protein